MHTKASVTPSAIRTEGHFGGTSFRNFEREVVARNIVIFSQRNGDSWFEFTWDDYAKQCLHTATEDERMVLNDLVEGDFLQYKDGIYSVTDSFVDALEGFIAR